MKKISIGVVTLIIGIGVAFFCESFFRNQIQGLFKWTTCNRIEFTGKNFYLFGSNFYYLIFGLVFSAFSLLNQNLKTTKILKNGIAGIVIFTISVIGISAIDANLKVIECTACNDGIRRMHWNDINYGVILSISAFLSIISSLIFIIKR